MAQNPSTSPKDKKLTIEEYAKIKEKLAKSRLNLSFPWIVKVCFIIPCIFLAFLVIYYLAHLRFVSEH